jgi:hypothetical protein
VPTFVALNRASASVPATITRATTHGTNATQASRSHGVEPARTSAPRRNGTTPG